MYSELLRAFDQPVRIQMLDFLSQGAATPRQVSDALSEGLASVSYHVEVLNKAGLIRPASADADSPAADTKYEVVVPGELIGFKGGELPPSARKYRWAFKLRAILERGVNALETGTFDAHPESHLSCLSFDLDSDGAEEINEILDETLRKVALALARSTSRLARSRGRGAQTTVIVASFLTGKGRGRSA